MQSEVRPGAGGGVVLIRCRSCFGGAKKFELMDFVLGVCTVYAAFIAFFFVHCPLGDEG